MALYSHLSCAPLALWCDPLCATAETPRMPAVVSPKTKRPGALGIQSARFDAKNYQTVLQLVGTSEPVEIEL